MTLNTRQQVALVSIAQEQEKLYRGQQAIKIADKIFDTQSPVLADIEDINRHLTNRYRELLHVDYYGVLETVKERLPEYRESMHSLLTQVLMMIDVFEKEDDALREQFVDLVSDVRTLETELETIDDSESASPAIADVVERMRVLYEQNPETIIYAATAIPDPLLRPSVNGVLVRVIDPTLLEG